jgi:signal transduction histidine kinase
MEQTAPTTVTRDQKMRALHRASLSLFSDLSLEGVLKRIVQAAMDLANAKYAALGVPDGQGGLERFISIGVPEEEQDQIEHAPLGEGLIGEMLRQGRSIRVGSIEDHPKSSGFPDGHRKMGSFLGVPISAYGRPLGQIYLTDKIDHKEFSEEDQTLIEMLAAYAASAIEIARLTQQARRVAVLEERDRIGMDLHDGIIQSIYAVGLTLDYVKLQLGDEPAQAESKIDDAIEDLNTVIRDLRSYILDLQPSRISTENLDMALAMLGQEFKANTLMEAELQIDHDVAVCIIEEPAAEIFHIAQEALANVAKHARATRTWLHLRRVDDEILLQIIDNGRGFDFGGTSSHLGHGLSNMQERADQVGGAFEVVTRPGDGTTITVRFPTDKVCREP